MRQHNFSKIIESGIASLSSLQKKDGNFLSFYSANSNTFTHAITYPTTFNTSLILLALHTIPEKQTLKQIKKKAASFLLTQKSNHWSWNYWTRESKEAQTKPYPDDLDDTFCALAALFTYDSKLIDGKIMAYVVSILTACEIAEGGPYKTWLVDQTANEKWQDVDIAVNSNLAYFLYLHEIDLPNISTFIESHIKSLNFSSPYYPSPLPIIYFISRFYNGKSKKKIINKLLEFQKTNNSFGNELDTALAITSLLNLGVSPDKVEKNIDYLLKKISKNGYKSYSFWLDPAIKDSKQFAGSKALTIAFCLETLTKYSKSVANERNIHANKTQIAEQEKIYNTILNNVYTRLSAFDNSFQKIASSLITKLTKKNTDQQILLLPYYVAKSINTSKKNISEKLLIQLGSANIFGWIAYTIFDDFLDNEGEPKKLSLANLALRESFKLFLHALPENNKYQIFFEKIFDQIDYANYWEIINCRNKNILPKYTTYDKLAEKSFGHALGPLTILFSLGYDETSQEVKQLLTFFKHFLIAKQLNDDAHDWKKDFKMQHINPVVTLLLQKSSQTSSIKDLEKLFWEKIIDKVSLLILQHVKKGKIALNKCSFLSNKTLLENMIFTYEKIAIKTLEEKKQTIKFLNNYNNE